MPFVPVKVTPTTALVEFACASAFTVPVFSIVSLPAPPSIPAAVEPAPVFAFVMPTFGRRLRAPPFW